MFPNIGYLSVQEEKKGTWNNRSPDRLCNVNSNLLSSCEVNTVRVYPCGSRNKNQSYFNKHRRSVSPKVLSQGERRGLRGQVPSCEDVEESDSDASWPVHFDEEAQDSGVIGDVSLLTDLPCLGHF